LSEPERLTWDEFTGGRLVWEQGEHVSLIGPTGAGKTTLALAILPMRKYVLAFGTKPSGRDSTLMSLVKKDRWKLVTTWEAMPRVIMPGRGRFVFWPRFKHPGDVPGQAYEIGQAMAGAFVQGGWCLLVDEAWYMTNVLGLKRMLEQLWTQGRSIGISVVAGTQRPAYVPLNMYDQATHVFFWRDNDERNLKRISGMNGLNAHTIKATVATLARHEVLYVNTRTGYMAVTKAPSR
jgi:hypothetical protein